MTAELDAQAAEITSRLLAMKIEAKPRSEAVAMIAYLQRLGVDGKRALEAK